MPAEPTLEPRAPASELDELRHEVRRLRQVLRGLVEIGMSRGAVVELYRDGPDRVGVVVCTASMDERALVDGVRTGLERLAAAVGGELDGGSFREVGGCDGG